MPITPEQYAELHNLKPLSAKEKKRGKEKVTISGTDEPMPWTEIYSRIAIGEPIENIAEKFGHARKIALWAIEDNVTIMPELGDVLLAEVEQRRKMDMIEGQNPTLALTIREAANEYAPDAARKSIDLSVALIDAGRKMIRNGDYSSNDLKNIADMLQRTTDTMGLTQRHSAGMNIENAKIHVTGFQFIEDTPEPIDVEVDDE